MVVINSLPDNFLIEKALSHEQVGILIEQINRFNKILSLGKLENRFLKDNDGRIFLNEGTIIHGTSYNEVKLKNISETGIITGQAFGKEEDGETFYCADFHRVSNDMSLFEYNNNFTYNDGRCPFGTKMIGQKQLAFIININEENRELLSYDCYRKDSVCGDITRGFVNENGLPLDSAKASSILYGVPSNCFSGIVLGDKLVEDKDKVNFIIKTFPWCYVCSRYGKIIYEPNLDKIDTFEYVEFMRKSATEYNEKIQLESKIDELNKKVSISELKYDKLLLTMLDVVPLEMVANVIMQMGYHGNENVLDYLNDLKDNNDKIK